MGFFLDQLLLDFFCVHFYCEVFICVEEEEELVGKMDVFFQCSCFLGPSIGPFIHTSKRQSPKSRLQSRHLHLRLLNQCTPIDRI